MTEAMAWIGGLGVIAGVIVLLAWLFLSWVSDGSFK